MGVLELFAGTAGDACGCSQASAATTCASISPETSFQSNGSEALTPSTQECLDVGAAVGSSEEAEHFVPQPELAKDFYARHLSSQPAAFSEEYAQSQDYFVRRALAATRANLVHLQPKVRLHDHTLEAALTLFRAFSADQQDVGDAVFQEDLYACLWVAAKLLAVRTAAPNRQLLCMATACAPDVLSWRELVVCQTLDWDMVEILRDAGML